MAEVMRVFGLWCYWGPGLTAGPFFDEGLVAKIAFDDASFSQQALLWQEFSFDVTS